MANNTGGPPHYIATQHGSVRLDYRGTIVHVYFEMINVSKHSVAVHPYSWPEIAWYELGFTRCLQDPKVLAIN